MKVLCCVSESMGISCVIERKEGCHAKFSWHHREMISWTVLIVSWQALAITEAFASVHNNMSDDVVQVNICHPEGSTDASAAPHRVLAAEQSGWASLIELSSGSSVQSISWQAHDGVPVLNVFWLEQLGSSVAVTSALNGCLRFWAIGSLVNPCCTGVSSN